MEVESWRERERIVSGRLSNTDVSPEMPNCAYSETIRKDGDEDDDSTDFRRAFSEEENLTWLANGIGKYCPAPVSRFGLPTSFGYLLTSEILGSKSEFSGDISNLRHFPIFLPMPISFRSVSPTVDDYLSLLLCQSPI